MIAPPLDERLRWVRRATLGRALVARFGRVVATSIVFILALVALDAFRPMPSWARAAISCVWIVGLIVGIIRAVWLAARGVPNLNATARLIEQRAAVPHNRIINARLFARAGAMPADALAPTLTSRSIELGLTSLAHADEAAILAPERALARRSIGLLATIAIVFAASFLALPRIFDAVLPRFAEPFADHPAYSLTDFRLTIDQVNPSQGDDISVAVRTTGKQPRSLRLVIRKPDAPSRALPLTSSPSDPGVHSVVLRNVRSPIRVHAEGDTGRGRAIEIIPITVPRITEAAATITPPAYSGHPSVTHALDPGASNRLSALVGARIDLHVGSTIRLREGGVSIHPSTPSAPPTVTAAGKTLRAHLGPIESHSIDIDVRPVSESGIPAEESVRLAIDPQPDAPPTLTLAKPAWSGEELLAPAHATLLFDAGASDDLGLQVLGLAYSLFDSRGVWRSFGTIMRARHDESPTLCASGETIAFKPRLPLARLGAEPGGSLIISILAIDTRVQPFGEPQHARIGPIVVRLAQTGAGGSCGGQRDGWIQLPSDSPNPGNDDGAEQPSDTWSSEAPPNQGRAIGDRRRQPGPSDRDQPDGTNDAQSGDAELNEGELEEVTPADPILRPADAPRRASPSGHREAAREPRAATPMTPDPHRQIPDAYRDVVTRYFQLLNEASNSTPASP